MKKLLTLLFAGSTLAAAAQENPFEEFGYTPRIATLSGGKYIEYFDRDTIVQIGSIVYNTKSKKIVGFVEEDTAHSEATLKPDVVSRWISPDPLAYVAPGWTPYRFSYDNPIYFVDPTGLIEDWFVNEITGEILHAPGESDLENVDVENKEDYSRFATDQEMTDASFGRAPGTDAEYETKTWTASEANPSFASWGVDRKYSLNSVITYEHKTMETKDFEIGGTITIETTINRTITDFKFRVLSPGSRISFNGRQSERLVASESPTPSLYPKLNIYQGRIMISTSNIQFDTDGLSISSNVGQNLTVEMLSKALKAIK